MSEPAFLERRKAAGTALTGPPALFQTPQLSRSRRLVLLSLIVLTAFTSLRFFYARGLTNIYGDAMAHMESARRLTDSLTPGYDEIGAVWLPLNHLLVAPLAMNDHLWRTGLGGSLGRCSACRNCG